MSTTTDTDKARADEADPETSSATREELLRKYRAACRERDHGADFDTRCIARSEVGMLSAEFARLGVWVFNGITAISLRSSRSSRRTGGSTRSSRRRGVPVQRELRGAYPGP